MNPLPLAVVIAYRLGQKIFGGDTLGWAEVNDWITHHGNRNNYGRGYTGSRLPPQAASNGFVELRREKMGDGTNRIIASVYFNTGSLQAVASKTWEATKLDKKLEEQFGKNLRLRISI
jgi:hypothetical protein